MTEASVQGVVFSYNPAIGEPALSTFGGASDGPVAIGSDALTQGMMAALIRAELYAIQMKAAPSISVNGQQGFVLSNVGGARYTAEFKAAPKSVQDTYMALQNAARRLSGSASANPTASVQSFNATVKAAIDANAKTGAAPGAVGALPVAIVVAIVVVAVAAIVATAFYATQTQVAQIQVEGKNMRFVSTMDQVVKLRMQGIEPPQELLDILNVLAKNEESMGIWPWVLGGVVALAGAGGLIYWWMGPARIKAALGFGGKKPRQLKAAEADA